MPNIVEPLLAALREARDALNGAPNTVGLHTQINDAINMAERNVGPDRYCYTMPDGECVSKDPRCMHWSKE